MEELIVVLLQLFFELFINVLASGLIDLVAFPFSKTAPDGCAVVTLHVIFGGLTEFVSTLIVPKLILPYLGLRLLNLFLGPVVAGGVSYLIAREVLKKPDGSGHFLHAFLFALMFGLARFAFAQH